MPSSEQGDDARLVRASESRPFTWQTNAWLFLATVASTFLTWMQMEHAGPPTRVGVLHALQYTGALMAILLAHEFGHYIAARIHKVDASLPYFIPLPFLSPFGTMGAVIRMRSVIPTRRALLDIGAAGPLAGLALAIPLYAWGIAHA
jgi:membrane-associated protease RseP (regulator of RpoE activity)